MALLPRFPTTCPTVVTDFHLQAIENALLLNGDVFARVHSNDERGLFEWITLSRYAFLIFPGLQQGEAINH